MGTIAKLLVAAVILFALLQLVRPSIPTHPATAEVQAPPEVQQILDKDCYSCHSGERRLSWFDQVVPAYWLVRHDILTARGHLDFTTLGAKPAAVQKATLYEAVSMIQLGAMPLPRFVRLHPDAKVTPEELAALKTYLAPWSQAPSPPAATPAPAAAPISLTSVTPELNGLAFEPTFETWKVISTTDRGDNNTFRFILGNEIAIQAAQTGNISPWPDGARFAKIAWQQQLGADGLVHPGNFIQVEFMVKNATQYKDTEGWGWGRWRGADLKPYGADAHFVNECTGCHQPLGGNDYVYTLPISTAALSGGEPGRAEVLNNAAAVLPASLPYQPLAWGPITMFVDPKTRTTATLYGNDAAMQAARAHSAGNTAYPAGAVLALVTWGQRDDPHWFGARIPGALQSVEFVEIVPAGQPNYRRFAGSRLAEDPASTNAGAPRTSFILGLSPVQLP